MTVIYIGPTVRGVVNHNQIFSYNPEDIIKKTMEREPLAGYLFVEAKMATEKKQEIPKKGTLINIIYHRLLKKEEQNGKV